MTNYPEHDKLSAVSEQSQTIGEFLEWLPSQGLHIGRVDKEYADHRLVPASFDIQDLLANFFEIDRAKIEDEKRAMLAHLRGEER